MPGTWFKVAVTLHDHRKARRAGRSAMGVWVLAGSWAAFNETDGFIPATMISRWGNRRDAQTLCDAGLWHPDTQQGEPGYRFHDWLDYNPDAYTVRLKDQAESAAGSKGNHIRWHVRRGVVDLKCHHCRTAHDTELNNNTNGLDPPQP